MVDIGAGMGGAGFGERNRAGQEDSDHWSARSTGHR